MGMFEGLDGYKEKLAEKTGLSKVSPLAGMVLTKVKGGKANEKAGGLGKMGVFSFKSAILAATAAKLYAFEFKSGWGGLKVKDPIAVWDREAIKVTAEGKSATSAIDIDVTSSGEHLEVEAMTMMGGGKYVEEFVAEVSKTNT